MFESRQGNVRGGQPAATVSGDAVAVTNAAALSADVIDRLAWTAAFGADAELKGTARWIIRSLAAAAGIRPASIHDLYIAMGRGEVGGFTVPAINVRAMTYDTARAVIRVGEKAQRRRVHLRDRALGDRLHRAASARVRGDRVRRRASRRVSRARSSSRATTSRRTPRSTTAPRRDKELETLRALIREEIAAGFYNIDIDTSTLVDLDKPTLDEQQEVNVTLAADFAAFIRGVEPHGVTVSVGGEIGEVGGKNSDVHELHAYMNGFNRKLKERGATLVGLSKISVQTGTAHGGFVNADGSVRKDVADRSEDARGTVAAWRGRTTDWAARCSTARPRCRPTRSMRSRGSAPARSIWRPISRTWSTSTRSFRPI